VLSVLFAGDEEVVIDKLLIIVWLLNQNKF